VAAENELGLGPNSTRVSAYTGEEPKPIDPDDNTFFYSVNSPSICVIVCFAVFFTILTLVIFFIIRKISVKKLEKRMAEQKGGKIKRKPK
jgi:hypothetical protein